MFNASLMRIFLYYLCVNNIWCRY